MRSLQVIVVGCAGATFFICGCRTHDFPQYPANYREYVYVTNGGSDTVTILDVVNVRIDRELPVGHNPVAIAAAATRNEIYVVNSGAPPANGSVSVIDAEHNAVVATIPVGRQPVSIDLKADGSVAYVANSGSNSVSVIDLAARREVAQIPAGNQPVAARLASDGKSLVVADQGGNSVTIIDPASAKIRAQFSGCPGASEVVILPDSTKAFIPCATGHQIMVVALAQPNASPAEPDRLETLMDVGRAPVDLALKPDGGEIFASNSLSDSISEIYNTTDEVGDTYMIGNNPVRGIVSRDNSLLYVANLHSQQLTVYSIDDGKRIGSISVGDGPEAMAFSAAGHLLFVADRRSGDVAVVRTSTRSLFTMLPAGRDPNAIVDKAFTVQ
ncbi:MAG TPA: beta-propeller fold lactonase family protein [Terracidiphilus sp.]|nr:beta-propeller fold lactonase family protein [Terracidiphilus sp.]